MKLHHPPLLTGLLVFAVLGAGIACAEGGPLIPSLDVTYPISRKLIQATNGEFWVDTGIFSKRRLLWTSAQSLKDVGAEESGEALFELQLTGYPYSQYFGENLALSNLSFPVECNPLWEKARDRAPPASNLAGFHFRLSRRYVAGLSNTSPKDYYYYRDSLQISSVRGFLIEHRFAVFYVRLTGFDWETVDAGFVDLEGGKTFQARDIAGFANSFSPLSPPTFLRIPGSKKTLITTGKGLTLWDDRTGVFLPLPFLKEDQIFTAQNKLITIGENNPVILDLDRLQRIDIKLTPFIRLNKEAPVFPSRALNLWMERKSVSLREDYPLIILTNQKSGVLAPQNKLRVWRMYSNSMEVETPLVGTGLIPATNLNGFRFEKTATPIKGFSERIAIPKEFPGSYRPIPNHYLIRDDKEGLLYEGDYQPHFYWNHRVEFPVLSSNQDGIRVGVNRGAIAPEPGDFDLIWETTTNDLVFGLRCKIISNDLEAYDVNELEIRKWDTNINELKKAARGVLPLKSGILVSELQPPPGYTRWHRIYEPKTGFIGWVHGEQWNQFRVDRSRFWEDRFMLERFLDMHRTWGN